MHEPVLAREHKAAPPLRAGVDFIAAGWTHTVPHIIETMQRISPHYCRTVAELTALLLDETEA